MIVTGSADSQPSLDKARSRIHPGIPVRRHGYSINPGPCWKSSKDSRRQSWRDKEQNYLQHNRKAETPRPEHKWDSWTSGQRVLGEASQGNHRLVVSLRTLTGKLSTKYCFNNVFDSKWRSFYVKW